MISQTSTQHGPSLGEKGLLLMNNVEEWENLKKSMRSSGITTNIAAKMMILNYLSKKSEEEIDEMPSFRAHTTRPHWNEEFWANNSRDEHRMNESINDSNISLNSEYESMNEDEESSRSFLLEKIKTGYTNIGKYRRRSVKIVDSNFYDLL